ncbi:MAG: hypothetical protein ACMUIE_03990 [Thermoplasmatota archaeon]
MGKEGGPAVFFLFLSLLLLPLSPSLNGNQSSSGPAPLTDKFLLPPECEIEFIDGDACEIIGNGILEIGSSFFVHQVKEYSFIGFDKVLVSGELISDQWRGKELDLTSSGRFELADLEMEGIEITLEAPFIEIRNSIFHSSVIWFTSLTGNITDSNFNDTYLWYYSTLPSQITNNTFNRTRVDITEGWYLNVTYNRFINGNTTLYAGAGSYSTSKLTSITNNTFESCVGIYFMNSQVTPLGPQFISNTHVRFNQVRNCSKGMAFNWRTYGMNVRISRNWFYHNRGTADNGSGPQIYPDWNSYGTFDILFHENGAGNCWQNHRTPDNDSDGIVDIPYNVSSYYRDVYDLYPLTSHNYGILAPKVNITNPLPGSKLMRNTTVNWTIDDHDVPVQEVWLIYDNDTMINVTGKTSEEIDIDLGTHTISIEAVDVAGLTGRDQIQIETIYSIDMINIGSPEEGGWLTWNNVEIAWEIDERFPVEKLELVMDDDVILMDNEDRSAAVHLNDGYHDIEIRSFEKMGWMINASLDLKVDTTPPEISMASPVNGSAISNPLVKFRWEIEDAMALHSASYRLDDGDWTDQEDPRSMKFDELMSSGEHKLEVKASDEAGWTSGYLSEFTIGSDRHRCIVIPESDVITMYHTVDVAWSVPSWFQLSHSEISMRETGAKFNVTGLNKMQVFLEEDGPNTMRLRFYDLFGNYYEEGRVLIKDTERPALNILDKRPYVTVKDPLVEWRATDEYGISHFKYRLDSEDWSDDQTKNSAQLNGLEEGKHILLVIAVDNAGNKALADWEFTVDTTPPQVRLTAPPQGKVVRGPVVAIEWDVSDPAGITDLFITMDGVNTLYESRGGKDFILDFGEHVMNFSVSDNAGNSFHEERSFLVDNDKPDLTWGMLTPRYSTSSVIILRWEEVEDTWVTERTLSIDDIHIEELTANETVIEVEEGEHRIEVTVTDAASRTSSISWTVMVDTTPPELGSLRCRETANGFDVFGRFYDNCSGLALVSLSINGVLVGDFEGNFTYHHEIEVKEGTLIEVKLWDKAGLTSIFNITFLKEDPGDIRKNSNRISPWMIVLMVLMVLSGGALAVFMRISTTRAGIEKKEVEIGGRGKDSTIRDALKGIERGPLKAQEARKELPPTQEYIRPGPKEGN